MPADTGPTLDDIGALARLKFADGHEKLIRLRGLIDSPDTLRLLWPHITDIVSPAAVVTALLATTPNGGTMVQEVEPIDFEQDGAAALESPVALTSIEIGAEAEGRRIRRSVLFGIEPSSSDLSDAEQAELRRQQRDKQRFQDRQWAVFWSPKRLQKARAALEARKPLDNELASLLYAREEAARAAALVAMEVCRHEYRERELKMIASFEKGDPNWKAAGWPDLQKGN